MERRIKYINYKTAVDFLLPRHYSGRIPSISCAFGWYFGDKLKAVCIFGKPASPLHDVPTVDVAPVIHGEWEPIINAYRELEGWICKCCGHETKQKSNYCPRCGCRMDGGSE